MTSPPLQSETSAAGNQSQTLLINAVASKAGGGLNDLTNTLPLLEQTLAQEGWRIRTWVVLAGAEALRAIGYNNQDVTTVQATSPLQRIDWEYRQFPRIVQQESPDAVFHFSNLIFRSLPFPQMTVLRSPTFYNAAYASRSRSGAFLKLRYLIGRRVAAQTVARADEVFCISESHRNDIIDTLGDLGRKVRVSYLGFDCPEVAQQLLSLDKASRLQRLSPQLGERVTAADVASRPFVVNIAHYYEHKNLGDLLRAMTLVRNDFPNVVLVITAGLTRYEGPWTDKRTADVQLARELAEDGTLVDLGPIAKHDVWPLMAAADVFAFPSSLESFGHPLLEAMSMRLPIVAADTLVHREIAMDVARYHAIGDIKGLANELVRALSQQPTDELLQRGEDRAADFSWQKHATDLAQAVFRLKASKAASVVTFPSGLFS